RGGAQRRVGQIGEIVVVRQGCEDDRPGRGILGVRQGGQGAGRQEAQGARGRTPPEGGRHRVSSFFFVVLERAVPPPIALGPSGKGRPAISWPQRWSSSEPQRQAQGCRGFPGCGRPRSAPGWTSRRRRW